MSKNLIAAAFFILMFAGIAVSQGSPANSTVSISSLNANITISVYVPNFTTPINPEDFLASTGLNVAGRDGNNSVHLQVLGINSLASQNVNVVLSQNSGVPPFNAIALLGVTPATKSGTYNITIGAISASEQSNSITLHLKVLNPTNATFLYANSSNPTPTAADARQELNRSLLSTSTIPTTTTANQGNVPAMGSSRYVAAVLIIIAIVAAVAFMLRKR